jgi:hypothetical protein
VHSGLGIFKMAAVALETVNEWDKIAARRGGRIIIITRIAIAMQ